MAIKKINYHGNSKILLRLCEVVNSIIDSGTGGSTVSYQQTLQSGTETGEITIDGVATKMYAPTPPTKVSDLQNDTGFITSTVSNLINYYTKTETYTKAEVDAAVAAVSTLNLLVVQTLPTQDISTTTIYLVPKQTAGTQNVYDEYIYIMSGGSGAWELIGDTTVDLSNYYTKTQVDNLLSAKVSDNPTFTEASTRANIASGESFATILGKIKKWFTDIPSMFVSKSGDTMSGNLTIDKKDGTASSVGWSGLHLGNTTSQGTEGNSAGYLRLCGKNNKWADIYDENGLTANRNLLLPDKSGTLALTNDISVKSEKISIGNAAVTYEITSAAYNTYFICGQASTKLFIDVLGVNTSPLLTHLGTGTTITCTGVSTTKVRVTFPAYFSGFILSGGDNFTIATV